MPALQACGAVDQCLEPARIVIHGPFGGPRFVERPGQNSDALNCRLRIADQENATHTVILQQLEVWREMVVIDLMDRVTDPPKGCALGNARGDLQSIEVCMRAINGIPLAAPDHLRTREQYMK